jgi:hypothetical protein
MTQKTQVQWLQVNSTGVKLPPSMISSSSVLKFTDPKENENRGSQECYAAAKLATMQLNIQTSYIYEYSITN